MQNRLLPLAVLLLAPGLFSAACGGSGNDPNGSHPPILDDTHDGVDPG